MAGSRAARGNRGFSQPRSIFLVPDSPWDLFPLLIRLASHIFSPKKTKKDKHLINCLQQRSDDLRSDDLLWHRCLCVLLLLLLLSASCSLSYMLFHFYFTRIKTILLTLNLDILTVPPLDVRRPCLEWWPPWPPATLSWDPHFLSHGSRRGDSRQSRGESFEGASFPFYAIQSVCMNTLIMMWCQRLIRSELENNEMPHYHNFPDLDEWFSNSG